MSTNCRANPLRGAFSRLATVRHSIASLLAFALTAAVAAGLSACGGDAQLLPGETAKQITANLDTVKQLAEKDDCVGAEDAAEQVSLQVDELRGVDPKLQEALRAGATRLNEVVANCTPPVVEETVEETTTPTPETTGGEKALKDIEKEEEKAEKEAEKEAKDAEKEAAEEEKAEEAEVEPAPPPAAGKGHGEGPPSEVPPPESSSGGISPGASVEGDEG